MFETLDVIISLAVVFLILSMVHKYLRYHNEVGVAPVLR